MAVLLQFMLVGCSKRKGSFGLIVGLFVGGGTVLDTHDFK